METKVDISQYCEECLKFKQKKCEGKSQIKIVTNWGQSVNKIHPGLNFCKLYEFDVRLYEFSDGNEEVETIKHVRKRQAKRNEVISNQEAFDDFDLGASLSSADLEKLV